MLATSDTKMNRERRKPQTLYSLVGKTDYEQAVVRRRPERGLD